MIDKLEGECANSKVQSRIDNFFLFFSTVSVAALLTLDMPNHIGLSFMLLQVVARVCVPMLLLMVAYDFFMLHEGKKDFLQEGFYLVRKGLILYLVYAVLYLIFYYFALALDEGWRSSYIAYFLRGLVAGEAPCSWMILSFLVGIVLVSYLTSLRQRPQKILLIAFCFYTISVFTEIYFKAIIQIHSLSKIWEIYSTFFVTTRNGLFYGFFWCALGYFMTFHRGENHKKHMIFFVGVASIAMLVEHSFAFSMGWPRDYKSSFMMIPVCVFILLLISNSARLSKRFFGLRSLFKKQMFIAFMLLPLISLGARRIGVPVGTSLFVVTLSVDLLISYFLSTFSDKISIKGYKLLAW